MDEIHFHVWLHRRDESGVITSMERNPKRFDNRRKASYFLQQFRRKHGIAGQALQCVNGTFCQPTPGWTAPQDSSQ